MKPIGPLMWEHRLIEQMVVLLRGEIDRITSKKTVNVILFEQIQLFEGMTPNQLDWVAQHAHRRNFEAGRNVMTIEQPGEAVYIILHGTVKIHIEQGERDVILEILGAGDLLGEMSLIDSVGRSASAVTLETSLMLWMDRTTFTYMLDNFPPVARNLV